MKILFMGTPDFAVPTLAALCASKDCEVVGVVTQPDKPKGRKMILTPPPVKVFATEHGIAVYQPATLKSDKFSQLLAELDPDVIVVVAYGKILPEAVLSYPKLGCINVHGSLLPKYRGAAPMQRAIMEGEEATGVTTMYMEQGLDTGDMLDIASITIEPDDNFETVHDKLSQLGAETLLLTLQKLKNGTAVRIKQDDSLSTYAKKIENADCLVDFSKSAAEVHNQIRGLSPIPLAFTHTPDGKMLKITSARPSERTDNKGAACGSVLSLEGGIEVACGSGSIILLGVLPEGKGKMSAADFIRGRKVNIGDILK